VDRPQPELLPNLAMAAAAAVLETRYPEAASAFVAGSIMRGQGTVGSDVDLVVLYPQLERARRESFLAEGFPFEVFIQDASTLAHYFGKDVAAGRPVLISMVAEGRIVGHDIVGAKRRQAEARALLAAGPSPEIDRNLLYQVSDLAEDLRGLRPAEEVRAIAVQLYPRLADLMLVGRRHWSGAGKWVPRRLKALGGELNQAFDAAMSSALAGDGAALLALCQSELDRHGGPFFDGYSADGVASTLTTSRAPT
jgi:predicted nucleotidyltransferase